MLGACVYFRLRSLRNGHVVCVCVCLFDIITYTQTRSEMSINLGELDLSVADYGL